MGHKSSIQAWLEKTLAQLELGHLSMSFQSSALPRRHLPPRPYAAATIFLSTETSHHMFLFLAGDRDPRLFVPGVWAIIKGDFFHGGYVFDREIGQLIYLLIGMVHHDRECAGVGVA